MKKKDILQTAYVLYTSLSGKIQYVSGATIRSYDNKKIVYHSINVQDAVPFSSIAELTAYKNSIANIHHRTYESLQVEVPAKELMPPKNFPI